MHVTRVPASCACACVRGSGPAPRTTEETPNGVLHAYRSIFGSLSPSSSLPHRDLWNVSNRTPSQLTSRFKPLHFSTYLSATWKLIVALFHNNSIYIYIWKIRSNFPQSSVEPREGARLGRGCLHCEREAYP